MDKLLNFLNNIKNPSRKYGPIPFWFLNDKLEAAEIERQLEEFNNKGVYGVVLHPRIGVPKSIGYLSDEYMYYIKVAVEKAASLDMKIVLYDEAMYPSGSAHGMVVAQNPKFAAQGIFLTDDPSEGKLISKTDSGKYIVQKPTGGTIRGIHWGEDDGEPNAPKAADLLSQESVDTFIKLTHERYLGCLEEHFGKTIIGFFTDEPELIGRIDKPKCRVWTFGFEDEIVKCGGLLPELEGLFTGEENDTVLLYNRLVFERECRIYYKSLSDWCKNHGICLMGHPHCADDIECERFFGIPGQDLVLRRVSPEGGGLTGVESVQAKCSADAARILGLRRNSNECYGACCRDNIPWYFTGADLKWFTDWLGVRGVNMFIPHAFYYSVRGNRKDERPPDVGMNNIWWEHFDVISAYIKRISYIMTDSRNTAKVCVMCENRNMPSDEVAWMYQNQIEFNYVPYNFVPSDAYDDGKLRIGDNVYEYVYNDWKGAFPQMKSVDSSDVDGILNRDVVVNGCEKDLRMTTIVKDGIKMSFFVNEGETPIDAEVEVNGTSEVVKVDLVTGSACRTEAKHIGEKTIFRLKLGVRESLLTVFADGETDLPYEVERKYAEVEFEYVSEDKDNFVKTYRGEISGRTENLYVKTEAEDMTECYVNGEYCGFGLLNVSEFYVSPCLKDGVNEVVIKVTGNAANRFSEHFVDYGMKI